MKADAAPDPDFGEVGLKDTPVLFFMPLELEQLRSEGRRTKRCGKPLGAVYVHCAILACMIDFDHFFGNGSCTPQPLFVRLVGVAVHSYTQRPFSDCVQRVLPIRPRHPLNIICAVRIRRAGRHE